MFTKVVVRGDGQGNILGYPTANFDFSYNELGLSPGVYASKLTVKGTTYHAALCVHALIGKVEAHILDFPGGELYGETVALDALDKVSDFMECRTLGELKNKIASDVAKVRTYFENRHV